MGSSRLGTSIGSLASWMTGSGIWLCSLGPAKNVFVFEMIICCSFSYLDLSWGLGMDGKPYCRGDRKRTGVRQQTWI